MTQTRNAIATLALRRLGLVFEEQQGSGYQQLAAEEAVDHAWSELSRQGITSWPLNEVPDWAANSFAAYIAGSIAAQFMDEKRASYFELQMPLAIRRLTAATHVPDNSKAPVRFEDF